MKMALTNGILRIIEADEIQKTIIKSWNQMRWIRGQQMYEGIASAELLIKSLDRGDLEWREMYK